MASCHLCLWWLSWKVLGTTIWLMWILTEISFQCWNISVSRLKGFLSFHVTELLIFSLCLSLSLALSCVQMEKSRWWFKTVVLVILEICTFSTCLGTNHASEAKHHRGQRPVGPFRASWSSTGQFHQSHLWKSPWPPSATHRATRDKLCFVSNLVTSVYWGCFHGSIK